MSQIQIYLCPVFKTQCGPTVGRKLHSVFRIRIPYLGPTVGCKPYPVFRIRIPRWDLLLQRPIRHLGFGIR